jgi:hypothetical protein
MLPKVAIKAEKPDKPAYCLAHGDINSGTSYTMTMIVNELEPVTAIITGAGTTDKETGCASLPLHKRIQDRTGKVFGQNTGVLPETFIDKHCAGRCVNCRTGRIRRGWQPFGLRGPRHGRANTADFKVLNASRDTHTERVL